VSLDRTHPASVDDRAALVADVHRAILDTGDGWSAATVEELVAARSPLLTGAARAEVVRRVLARIGGLGPLEPLLADPSVAEVMVNGPGPVWVERDGRVERTDVRLDDHEIDHLVERIAAPLGRRVDRRRPWVDGRLADGSRVNIVVAPVAVDGACITIRRFVLRRLAVEEFAEPPVAAVLRAAVERGDNIVVSGGTSSGKTTLLNALGSLVNPAARIVTVEDAAELQLPHPHVVRLEGRPESVEGVGAVHIRDLVRNALRMRPDRIIVGEVRGAEALDLIQALNTGHAGCLSTVHANGPADALARLGTLALMAGSGLPIEAVDRQLGSAIDLIVHVARDAGGRRRILEVAAVDRAATVRPLVRDGRLVGAEAADAATVVAK